MVIVTVSRGLGGPAGGEGCPGGLGPVGGCDESVAHDNVPTTATTRAKKRKCSGMIQNWRPYHSCKDLHDP